MHFNTKKLSPKINVIINTSQDKRGGFEKYPKDKSFDQSQYWASSPNRSNVVEKIANIFSAVIQRIKKRNDLTIIKIYLKKTF